MTQRTYQELESLLADNSTGDISASDVRDLLESLSSQFSYVEDLDPARSVSLTANTWVDVPLGPSNTAPTELEADSSSIDLVAGEIVLSDYGLYNIDTYLEFSTNPGDEHGMALWWWSGVDWQIWSGMSRSVSSSIDDYVSVQRVDAEALVSASFPPPQRFKVMTIGESNRSADVEYVWVSVQKRPVVKPKSA